MKADIKKIAITGALLLPIVILTIFTFSGDESAKKMTQITETTLNLTTPADVADSIAELIEEDDRETALVAIEERLQDPNISTSRGMPLIVLAAEKNNYDIAALLLAKGSEVNYPDLNSGETALIKAARNGNIDLMNLLIIANADVNAQNKRGVTPLTAAIQNGAPALTEFLMSRGSRAGATQENMLNYAFQKKFVGVDAMLKSGINPNFTDKNGNTPLIISTSHGDFDSVKAMITYRANVNAANNTGMTPLLYAIQIRNKEITDYLLEKGADINKANNNGETPLFWAAYFGNTLLVDDLLKLDADYKAVTKTNLTAVDIAERRKHADTATLLKNFIAYKNIPRDERGRPIVPKKGSASANKSASVALSAGTPTNETDARQLVDGLKKSADQTQKAATNTPNVNVGAQRQNTQVNTLRTSSL